MKEESSMKTAPRRHPGPGGPGGHGGPAGMIPGEKPKHFRKSFGDLLRYMGRYRIGVFFVMIFAAASTVFNVMGPKIM